MPSSASKQVGEATDASKSDLNRIFQKYKYQPSKLLLVEYLCYFA